MLDSLAAQQHRCARPLRACAAPSGADARRPEEGREGGRRKWAAGRASQPAIHAAPLPSARPPLAGGTALSRSSSLRRAATYSTCSRAACSSIRTSASLRSRRSNTRARPAPPYRPYARRCALPPLRTPRHLARCALCAPCLTELALLPPPSGAPASRPSRRAATSRSSTTRSRRSRRRAPSPSRSTTTRRRARPSTETRSTPRSRG